MEVAPGEGGGGVSWNEHDNTIASVLRVYLAKQFAALEERYVCRLLADTTVREVFAVLLNGNDSASLSDMKDVVDDAVGEYRREEREGEG